MRKRPRIEQCRGKRINTAFRTVSPHAEPSAIKFLISQTPPSLRSPSSSFISKYEKSIIRACRETSSQIDKIKTRVDSFVTSIDDRLDFLKSFTPPPKRSSNNSGIPTSSPTPTLSSQKPSKLSILQRDKSQQQSASIENLLKGADNTKSQREETITMLQKNLNKFKSLCIEDLFKKITRNDRIYESYRKNKDVEVLDPFMAFNQVCAAEKMPPIPVLARVQNSALVLNRYRINDALSTALAKSLSIMPYISTLHLDENSITDQGGGAILKSLILNSQLTSLFYTNNEIGQQFAAEFKEFLCTCPLTELSLHGCKASAAALTDLIESLSLSKTLKKLNLSEISLSPQPALQLARYLRRCTITEINLSWTNPSQDSSLALFKMLKLNKSLCQFDYRWNSLSEEGAACIILNQALMQHPRLMHLNLSFTKLTHNNFSILSSGIQSSRALVSVHFTGNNISDQKLSAMMIAVSATFKSAFLIDSAHRVENPVECAGIKQNSNEPASKIKFHKDSKRYKITAGDTLRGTKAKELIFTRYLGETTLKEMKSWIVTENCWVCEHWRSYSLRFDPKSFVKVAVSSDFAWSSQSSAALKLKSSFNLWEDLIIDNDFVFTSILPPGRHRFWVVAGDGDINITRQICSKKWGSLKVNEFCVSPRVKDLEPIELYQESQKKFDKSKSVFRSFIEDDSKTMKIMFESDKQHLKLERIIKDEAALSEVYNTLLSNLSELKEIFDATSVRSSYPNISWMDFSSFCEQCQMIDKKFLNRAAIDRCFIAANVDFDQLDDNPKQELCRYEFLEVVVRLALCKYQDLQLSPADMTEKLIEEHIFKYIDPSKAMKFRKERLYTYEVNSFLEANLENCQTLFNKYRQRPNRWMTIDGYKRMLNKSGFAIKEESIMMIYAYSKMSILDEMAQADSYDRMLFVEFLESLGRLSETLHKGPSAPLADIMDKHLDVLFSKHGLKLKTPAIDSDDDF